MFTKERVVRGVLAMGVLGFVAGIANTLRVVTGTSYLALGECSSGRGYPCVVSVTPTIDWPTLAGFASVHSVAFVAIFVAVMAVAAAVRFGWRHLSQPSQTG
jgi:hypothetical protein